MKTFHYFFVFFLLGSFFSFSQQNKTALLKAELVQKKLQMERRASEAKRDKKDKKILEKALLIQEKKEIREATDRLKKAQKQAYKMALSKEKYSLKNSRLEKKRDPKKKIEELESRKKIVSKGKLRNGNRLNTFHGNKKNTISSTDNLKKLKRTQNQMELLEKEKGLHQYADQIEKESKSRNENRLDTFHGNEKNTISSTDNLRQSKVNQNQIDLLEKNKNLHQHANQIEKESKSRNGNRLDTFHGNEENAIFSTDNLRQSKLNQNQIDLLEKHNGQHELASDLNTESSLKKERQRTTINKNIDHTVSVTKTIKHNKLYTKKNALSKKHKNLVGLSKDVKEKKQTTLENKIEALELKKRAKITYRKELNKARELEKERTATTVNQKRKKIQLDINEKLLNKSIENTLRKNQNFDGEVLKKNNN